MSEGTFPHVTANLVSVIGDTCADVGECGGIQNIECRDEGAGLQCLCEGGYKDDGSGTVCVQINKCTMLFLASSVVLY